MATCTENRTPTSLGAQGPDVPMAEATLFTQSFEPTVVADVRSSVESRFAFALPLSDAVQSRLKEGLTSRRRSAPAATSLERLRLSAIHGVSRQPRARTSVREQERWTCGDVP